MVNVVTVGFSVVNELEWANSLLYNIGTTTALAGGIKLKWGPRL